jgi:hypothetical protein
LMVPVMSPMTFSMCIPRILRVLELF